MHQSLHQPTCLSCKFWLEKDGVPGNEEIAADAGVHYAECRRMPPQKQGSTTSWPITAVDDWCGEHHPYLKEQ